jgi:hypothetical protein
MNSVSNKDDASLGLPLVAMKLFSAVGANSFALTKPAKARGESIRPYVNTTAPSRPAD